MRKNVVQDVIPPRKSIRNIELLHKSRQSVKKPIEENETEAASEDFSYKYEYDIPAKKSRKTLYVFLVLFLLVLVFGISALFKGAKINITPKNQVISFDESFKATKDTPTSDLSFQIVSTSKDLEKTMMATDEQEVEKKATGTIVVYNDYSTQSQTLIKTTRFETPEGLIFRSLGDVVVPGKQTKDGKTVAGSIEVLVEADKPGSGYNIPFKDFTIPGFKGGTKYTKFYGRSKTEMSGGFIGIQKTISEEALNKANVELEAELKSILSQNIISQIPENFVLYPDGLSYKIEPVTQNNMTSESGDTMNTVVLKKKGSVSAIIFDKGSLSRSIISRILPEIGDNIKITNLDSLKFSFLPDTIFNMKTSSVLNFKLTGEANLIWVIDENRLKSDLLGMSKNNALIIIDTYQNLDEAEIELRPFWNNIIPEDPEKVDLINTLDK